MVRSVYVCRTFPDVSLPVRNRSKEIVELLSDVEKIRAERRKAKTNKSKYTGVSNEGWSPSSGTRYGGFGSDSFSSGGGGSYGSYDGDDDGGYSGSGSRSGGDGGYSGGSYSGGSNSKRFQEYDAGDDETPRRSSLSTNDTRPSNQHQKGKSSLSQTTAPSKASEKPPMQEVDLLGSMDDDAFGSGSTISPPVNVLGLAPPQPAQLTTSLDGMHSLVTPVPAEANRSLVDDDFDDFQAAPTPTASSGFIAPAPQPLRSIVPLQPPQQTKPIAPFQPAQQFQPIQPTQQPNFLGSGMNVMSAGSRTTTPSYAAPNYNISTSIMPTTSPPQQGGIISPGLVSGLQPSVKPATSANFDDLWNLSLGTSSTAKKPSTIPAPAKSMKDLEKEKAAAGIWGALNQNQARQPTMGGGLWGPSNTSANSMNATKPSGGVDDLLF